jgi:hypothetical protein
VDGLSKMAAELLIEQHRVVLHARVTLKLTNTGGRSRPPPGCPSAALRVLEKPDPLPIRSSAREARCRHRQRWIRLSGIPAPASSERGQCPIPNDVCCTIVPTCTLADADAGGGIAVDIPSNDSVVTVGPMTTGGYAPTTEKLRAEHRRTNDQRPMARWRLPDFRNFSSLSDLGQAPFRGRSRERPGMWPSPVFRSRSGKEDRVNKLRYCNGLGEVELSRLTVILETPDSDSLLFKNPTLHGFENPRFY